MPHILLEPHIRFNFHISPNEQVLALKLMPVPGSARVATLTQRRKQMSPAIPNANGPDHAQASSRHRFHCIDLLSVHRGSGLYAPPSLGAWAAGPGRRLSSSKA